MFNNKDTKISTYPKERGMEVNGLVKKEERTSSTCEPGNNQKEGTLRTVYMNYGLHAKHVLAPPVSYHTIFLTFKKFVNLEISEEDQETVLIKPFPDILQHPHIFNNF